MLLAKHHKIISILSDQSNLMASVRYFYSRKLNDYQQRAIIAQAAIEIIAKFRQQNYLSDKRSIRQLLLDRKIIDMQIKRILITPSIDEKQSTIDNKLTGDLNFSEQNYQEVLKAFNIKKGINYDKQVYVQDRMKQAASSQDKIALSPTSITAMYFTILHRGLNGLFSGSKGTGKSFSFLAYDYLTSFRVQHNVSLGQSKINPLKQIVKQDKYYKVRHLCYINIKQNANYSDYFLQIMRQYPDIYPIKQIQKDFSLPYIIKIIRRLLQSIAIFKQFTKKYSSKVNENEPVQSDEKKQTQVPQKPQQEVRIYTRSQLISLLTKIQQKAAKYDVKTICVIDQANRIYGLLRNLHIEYENNIGKRSSYQKLSEYKQLAFYYDLLSIFTNERTKTHFESCILNSSQQFQLELSKDSNNKFLPKISATIQLLTLLHKERRFGSSYSIKYSEITNRATGQIQLYNAFWFELLKFISQNQQVKSILQTSWSLDQQLSEHRRCFEDQFGISSISNENTNIQSLKRWRNEVRHLDIRNYLLQNILRIDQNILLLSFDKNNSIQRELSELQKKKIGQNLRQLKKMIEQSRSKSILLDLKKYIQQGPTFDDKNQRIGHLKSILSQAKAYHQKQGEQNMVDYSQYTYLEGLTDLQKRVLVQSINFGFVSQQALRFSMSLQELIVILKELMKDNQVISIVAQISQHLLIDPKTNNINADFGRFLDLFSYPIFSAGNLKVTYIEYTCKKQGNLYTFAPEQIQFKLLKSCPVIGITNLSNIGQERKKLKLTLPPSIANYGLFYRIVQKANQNVGEYIAGFPAEYYNIEKQTFGPFLSNALFDNMIIKKSTQSNYRAKYEIILYDWTMGKPSSKTSKNFLEKIRALLLFANIEGDIDCKLLIVAPDYNVADYLNKLNGNTNQRVPQDLFCSSLRKEKIGKTIYEWNISVGVASFHKPPFKSYQQGHIYNLLYHLMQEGCKKVRRVSTPNTNEPNPVK